MWDLWWTKRHWDRFFPEYLGFLLSISFHRCSITWKNEKILIIFITVLHNKPQGCGASVASAAEPFTTKKKTGVLVVVFVLKIIVREGIPCTYWIRDYVSSTADLEAVGASNSCNSRKFNSVVHLEQSPL
jgi:hypothetical protein